MEATLTRSTRKRRRSRAGVHALVMSNRGLVYTLAGRIRRPFWMTAEDVCQEGMFGLIRAAQTFDPTRGFKFSTYACQVILRRMMRAARVGTQSAREVQADYHEVSTCDTIAVDLAHRDHVEQLLACVRSNRDRQIVRLRYGLATGSAWTLQEIGARMGLTRERVRQILALSMLEMRTGAYGLGGGLRHER